MNSSKKAWTVLVIWACSGLFSVSAATAEGDQLDQLVEAYFDEALVLNPVFATFIGVPGADDKLLNNLSPVYVGAALALEQRYLAELDRIKRSQLSAAEQITYDVFKYAREMSIEGQAFPGHLTPINQMFSIPALVALWGSGAGAQKFETPADYENFISRAQDFSVWVDQAIENMQQGMATGVVQPKHVVKKVLPQLAAHLVSKPEDSMFYQVIRNMPESFTATEKDYLAARYKQLITETLVPSYQRLHDFMKNTYLLQARDTVGLSAVPNGKAWYQYMIKLNTTTDYTAKEIHRTGLQEVARIHDEMRQVMAAMQFNGSLSEFFVYMKTEPSQLFETEAQMLAAYQAIRSRVEKNMDQLFVDIPDAEFEIRPIEAFRAASTASHYSPAATDGSRKGVFYLNTHAPAEEGRWATESLFLHEAVPGHHFQTSLQQEAGDLPRFRRFGSYTGYVEGWGLYAETLGAALGLYQSPEQQYGQLSHELMRAIRLVVDTGLHAKGWSRQQAVDYFTENSSLSADTIEREVDRYIAIPGQALAYKVGMLKIQALRKQAEKSLGKRFELAQFHQQVLASGALPLSVLENKIKRWIKASR